MGRSLTAKQRNARLAKVSKRAQALYRNVRRGKFYRAYDPENVSPPMKELIKTGLVRAAPRVVVIGSYYVPDDYKMFKLEMWRGKA